MSFEELKDFVGPLVDFQVSTSKGQDKVVLLLAGVRGKSPVSFTIVGLKSLVFLSFDG